ncbi:hypothetical protein [Cupriavidus pauculus]
MRNKLSRLLVFAAFAAVCATASAADGGVPVDSILLAVQQAMAVSAQQINQNVYKWLGAFLMVQFIWTNANHLLSGEADLQKAVGALARAVASAGIYLYFIQNGPGFIDAVGNMFISGSFGTLPDTSDILTQTMGLCGGLVLAIAVVGLVSSSLATLLVYVTLTLFACGAYLAVKVFMLQLELGLIVMTAPMSFSMLGLKALREQGIAPFKSLIALAYRAVLLVVIYASFGVLVNNVGGAITSVASMTGSLKDALQIGPAIQKILYSIAAFPLLAFLAYKSDAFASSLAGGSVGGGVADVAGAAAAGAAAGVALASGGAAALGAAGKVPQSMAGFMDNLAGGSISNASPMGVGGGDAPVFTPPASAPSLSVGAPGAGSGAASAPPQRPESIPLKEPIAPPHRPLPGETGQESAGQAQAPGTATDAAIGGPPGSGSSKLEEKLEQLVDHMTKPKTPTLGERLGEANRHLSQERAETRVSISPHGHD